MSDEKKWRWRFERWTGVWFGPLPVGMLCVLAGLIWVYVRYYRGTW